MHPFPPDLNTVKFSPTPNRNADPVLGGEGKSSRSRTSQVQRRGMGPGDGFQKSPSPSGPLGPFPAAQH